MSMQPTRIPLSATLVLAAISFAPSANATPREECLDAHSRAQDLRERGQLARARQTFLTCAQSSCPSVVQADCAKSSDEIGQLVPTVTFSARDATAADLPNTTVYVDDVLVTSRLDDGKTYEVDPGKHVIRYVHDGRETSLKVVLSQGEKGRLLVATFLGNASAASRRDRDRDRDAARDRDRDRDPELTEPPRSEPTKSSFPLVVAGLGGAAAITGTVLAVIGASNIPDNCSTSTRECAAPPGDPSIADAASSTRLANTGLAIGIGGAVVLVGGLVWYLVQPSSSRRGKAFSPFITF